MENFASTKRWIGSWQGKTVLWTHLLARTHCHFCALLSHIHVAVLTTL